MTFPSNTITVTINSNYESNNVTLSFLSGAAVVEGNLTIGDGIYTGVVVDATFYAPTVDLNGDVVLNQNSTLEGASINPITVAGDWTNNGGTLNHNNGAVVFDGTLDQSINGTATTQTFYDLEVDKSGGSLSVGGSTTTLSVENYTNTLGNFTGPATLNVNGDVILTAGQFTNGATTNMVGIWTCNPCSY